MRKKVLKKIGAGLMTVALMGGAMTMIPALGPDDAHAFSSDLANTCQSGTYGKGAAGTDANAIDDMVCTVYNLATGAPGKGAAIALIGYGFIRAAGLWGNSSFLAAAPPFLAGVGLASADGLAGAAGFSVE